MGSSALDSALGRGGIAVIPTDTIYGIVTKAQDRKAVLRLHRIRRKTPQKPFIVLIDAIDRLREFGITLTSGQKAFLKKVWPGKVSVILACNQKKLAYLHLKTNTLAFRLPKSKKLLELLQKTGPLVAPSANPEGKKPAQTIVEAKKYFGDAVDVYVNAGRKESKPSTLVSLLEAEPKVLREGAVKIDV